MDVKTRQKVRRLLETPTDGLQSSRLVDDAERLWARVKTFAARRVADIDGETVAVELACYALQMPLMHRKNLPAGKLGRTSLKDRAEQSAELLVSQLGDELTEDLLDHTTRVLHELPQKSPVLDAAKLLADAVNLEDFGVVGFSTLAQQLGRQGDGVLQLLQACEKRELYGYWDARVRDGFHFEPIRRIARKRLEELRRVLKSLEAEMSEDRA